MNQRQIEALLRRALDAVRCYDSRSDLVYELEEGLRQLANATEEAHAQADIRLADALAATGEQLAAANATLERATALLHRTRGGLLHSFLNRISDVILDAAPSAREGNATGPTYSELFARVSKGDRDLAAANARAEELTEKCYKSAQLLLEANARADAAERKLEQLEEFPPQCTRHATLTAERDQLAQKLDAAERKLGALRATEMQLRDERDLLATQLNEARQDNADTLAKWEASAQKVERLMTQLQDELEQQAEREAK